MSSSSTSLRRPLTTAAAAPGYQTLAPSPPQPPEGQMSKSADYARVMVHDGGSELELHDVSKASAAAPTAGGTSTDVMIPAGHTKEDAYTFFPIPTREFQDLVDPKSLKKLQELGGIEEVARKLQTDLRSGLKSEMDHIEVDGEPRDELFGRRRLQYGRNVLPKARSTPFWELVWEALQDRTLIILMIAALISIAIGIYDEVQQNKRIADEIAAGLEPGPKEVGNWVEGLAIMIAVVVVVLINSVNDYNKEKQFRKLNEKKDERLIKVIRDGEQSQVWVHDIVVGDLILIEYGDLVCADGIFVEGHDVKCDESGMTGESDAIKKGPGKDPFMLSGTKVLEGSGRMLVIAVGPYSLNGKTLLALRTESENTPLQDKLEDLAETIGKIGVTAASLLLVILIIEYLVKKGTQQGWPPGNEIATSIVGFFITAITIIVVAVPEGLPMAVALALSYATIQMLKDQNLVRVLASCETMGGATTICSDKTGTLTQNRMTVVRGSIARVSFNQEAEATKVNQALAPEVIENLIDGLAINASAYEGKDDTGKVVFTGSKTEIALLTFVKMLESATGVRGTDYLKIRDNTPIEHAVPFSSDRKRMSTIVKRRNGPGSVLHCKGASEIIVGLCTSYVDETGRVLPMTETTRAEIDQQILQYATDALRTIGIAYKYVQLPAGDEDIQVANQESELVFLGVVGIQDPLRPEVPEAVRMCQHAGIKVRMVTGDNLTTAKNIAKNCGILSKGGIIMEGAEFRRLTPEQMERVIPNLEVLARSSPTDKQLLVGKLKERGETVAVTGDGTNDAPALKLADVGFAMGIAGTEVAKEASDIVLMDDNFASIVKAVMWGRSVFDSVRKFLQFQLTVNVAAVVLAFISAISDSENESVLTAIQLLWINLIMDTMAALALATQPPTMQLLDRKPHKKTDALVNFTMAKMIVIQALFQIGVNLFLLYYGPTLFQLDTSDSYQRAVHRTMIFNTFVFMQVFNEVNCRNITRELNVFKDIHRNWIFIAIFFITVVVQFIVAQFGGPAFQTTALNWWQWLVCVIIGAFSLPIGFCVRLIPDMPEKHVDGAQDDSQVTREKLLWESAIRDVRRQVRVVRALRNGRRGFLHK